MSKNIFINKEEKSAFADIARVVLKYALLGIAVGIFLTSPSALSKIIPELVKLRKKYGDKLVDKSLNKIVKDRFIKVTHKNGKTTLKITEKGKIKLINFNIDTIEIQKMRWDGKWRFVVFDIPEKSRVARDVLRQKLKEIGFMQIQKSVWASPFECQDEIAFISSVYDVEPYVNYLIAEKIDHEKHLKKQFGLNL